jgi:hypothetical protein
MALRLSSDHSDATAERVARKCETGRTDLTDMAARGDKSAKQAAETWALMAQRRALLPITTRIP